MEKIEVKVCGCSSCMMNGSLYIAESIESLSNLKIDHKFSGEIEVETVQRLGGETGDSHNAKSPIVSINGKLFEGANSETVMDYVLSLVIDSNQN